MYSNFISNHLGIYLICNICPFYIVGKSFIERFEGPNYENFQFMTVAKAETIRKQFKEMNKWNQEKKSYILNANQNKLIPSADNIFVVECEYMSLDRDESVPQKNQRVISLLVRLSSNLVTGKSTLF